MPWLLPLLMLVYHQEQDIEKDDPDDAMPGVHLAPMAGYEILACVAIGVSPVIIALLLVFVLSSWPARVLAGAVYVVVIGVLAYFL